MDTTKLTNQQFIIRAKSIFGDSYEYPEYVNARTKMLVWCKECKNNFARFPLDLLRGYSCPICKENDRKIKLEQEFIEKAKEIHKNNYNYNYMRGSYYDRYTKIKILCKKCNNIFLQAPSSHLTGAGCPECYQKSKAMSNEEFLLLCDKKYDVPFYILDKYYNMHKPVRILCSRCGILFKKSPREHLKGFGCPDCDRKTINLDDKKLRARGEKRIIKFLEKNNIKYKREKVFLDCRNPKTNKCLRFDFYLPERELLIEYDGIHHFQVLWAKWDSEERWEKRKFRDGIKNKYAKDKNIPLLRIPYTKFEEIPQILKGELDV